MPSSELTRSTVRGLSPLTSLVSCTGAQAAGKYWIYDRFRLSYTLDGLPRQRLARSRRGLRGRLAGRRHPARPSRAHSLVWWGEHAEPGGALRRIGHMNEAHAGPTVFVIDDDPRVRRWIIRLLDTVGIAHAEFEKAEGFLEHFDPDAPGCILLDVRMPGMGGRVLHEKLVEMGVEIPILFMTGFGEVSIAVDVLQKGAVEFLEKPIKGQDLLDRVQKSLDLDAKQRTRKRSREEKFRVLERLTPRERQVVDLILEGHSSKRIAYKLSVSSQAIDARRANAMRKLGVTSMAELVAFVLSHRSDSESS